MKWQLLWVMGYGRDFLHGLNGWPGTFMKAQFLEVHKPFLQHHFPGTVIGFRDVFFPDVCMEQVVSLGRMCPEVVRNLAEYRNEPHNCNLYSHRILEYLPTFPLECGHFVT